MFWFHWGCEKSLQAAVLPLYTFKRREIRAFSFKGHVEYSSKKPEDNQPVNPHHTAQKWSHLLKMWQYPVAYNVVFKMCPVSFIMQSSEPLQEWKGNHHCWDEGEIRIILPLFHSNHHKNDFNNQLEALFKSNNFKEIIAKNNTLRTIKC